MFDGDIFEHDGNRFRFTTEHDDSMGAPWEEHDGHGPVSESRYHMPGMGSKPPKRAGERLLYWDHGHYRTYDFAEAVKIARRDGWGTNNVPEGASKGQIAAQAVEEDFQNLKAWCNDGWYWLGVIVTLVDDDGETITGASASLWGIESTAGDYLDEVAHDLAGEVLGNLKRAGGVSC